MSMRLVGVAVLTAVLALACDDDATGTDGDSAVGTYALARINGFPVPVPVDTYEEDGMTCVDTVTSGTATLRADQTWDVSIQLSITCTDNETSEETTVTDALTSSGTFSQSGNTVTFTETGSDPFTGVLSGDGDTLTVTAEDDGTILTLEFIRQ